MKKLMLLVGIIVSMSLLACDSDNQSTTKNANSTKTETMGVISKQTCTKTVSEIMSQYANLNEVDVQRGVENAAKFWMNSDGSAEEFTAFCVRNYAATAADKEALFNAFSRNLEVMYGHFNDISVELKRPIHQSNMTLTDIDEDFSMLDPFAHFMDDMYSSKIAFRILLNFPFYSLEEKNTLGREWTRKEWAYARLGDVFASRVPASIAQQISTTTNAADNYIANYNIVMGNLCNDKGEQLFQDGMELITHWGLRDELKSDYADKEHGLEKQRMIYNIMLHIANQTIPADIVNNRELLWNPTTNVVTDATGKEVTLERENDVRFQYLYDIWKAMHAADAYSPTYPTYLQRSFDLAMEVSADEIEKMFVELIASPQVAATAELIKQRLGRDLEPFDIWYDGFKSRSNIDENKLSETTRKRYPTPEAFHADTKRILTQLGFDPAKAAEIQSRVVVDPSRGAGHAWQAMMKGDKAHLRTRIADNGMDYKGYNIATHEFGHNVEQTLSLYDVDYYTMVGVPSTAFTEALAFVFQTRDLQLLGINGGDNKSLFTLDVFWGCYEIMGVALVDLYSWRFLYEHPNATMQEFKAAILENAQKVWNQYYAPVLGGENSTILAIYSHMFSIPLYLPNYPYGHLVQFQLEEFLEGKNLGAEVCRIYPAGRYTPNIWMQNAVGANVSVQPILRATSEAVEAMK